MVLPDINLLVYAYNADAPQHRVARDCWENLLNSFEPVGVPWIVSHGFIRIMTHPRVLEQPLRIETALQYVHEWLEWPSVEIITPGKRHLQILESLLAELGTGGNMVTDTVLAALAIEYQCQLYSNDNDFARFSGLRWIDPLK